MIPQVNNIGIIGLEDSEEKYQEYKDRLNYIIVPSSHNPEYRFVVKAFNGNSPNLLLATKTRVYPHWNLNQPEKDEFWNRDMTAGEIGCVISHLIMWKGFANVINRDHKGYTDSIMIFEEDFCPAESTIDWSRMNELKNYDWDLLFLGRRLQKDEVDTEVGLKYFVQPGFSYQAHAYLLSKNGLNKLINYYVPILSKNLIPTDEFLPATYMNHPREDINRLFPIKRLKALATREDWFRQTDWEGTGRSRTAPNEVQL